MGMFDRYYPKNPVPCPICGTTLDDWQSKRGPCLLYDYHEGKPIPIPFDPYPPFEIYTNCDECKTGLLYLECIVENGVWVGTGTLRNPGADS